MYSSLKHITCVPVFRELMVYNIHVVFCKRKYLKNLFTSVAKAEVADQN